MRARALGVLFAVAMSLLLTWNVYAAYRNQRTFEPHEVPARRSRNLTTLVRLNSMSVIRYTYAMYYQLRDLLSGKTLIVPERWAGHRYSWERVSRLHIEVVPELMVLPADRADALHALAVQYGRTEAATELGILVDPTAERYVLVQRATPGVVLVLPEALYRSELAR
ncbi:MAG: hypothetical protein KF773_39325 [Deltaproteobacteria bacterium]|nr:hypothetical protein [Deltaproteobacteria bacterium]MCW5806587.1 hypothetical protein [Deltaproteobacteria bacterium]